MTTRDWWPICAVCGKVVDNLEVITTGSAVVWYAVTCHGETEVSFVGIWAAFEIAQGRKRLRDAFTSPRPGSPTKAETTGAADQSSSEVPHRRLSP